MDLVPVSEVRVGDSLDLQNDQYADPKGEVVLFEFEFGVVNFVERETSDCIVLGIEGFDRVGFPAGHQVKRIRREETHPDEDWAAVDAEGAR